jgi:hypothetical protein
MNYILIDYILKVRVPTAQETSTSLGLFLVIQCRFHLHLPFLACPRCAAATAVLVMWCYVPFSSCGCLHHPLGAYL